MQRTTVREPRTQVQHVGTKQRPVPQYTGSPNSAQAIAKAMMERDYGWGSDEFSCLVQMWNNESGWRTNAYNPSGAYGIPQALPGSKMASAGPELADRRDHADQVGTRVHRGALRHAVWRVELLAGAQLLLSRRLSSRY